MDGVILANKNGKEIRALDFDRYDIEVGTTDNTFQFEINRQAYEELPQEARIYIPGTEYGGLCRRLGTTTRDDEVRFGGYTWRGMMQKKIIEPPAGADYATDTGELNEIIDARVQAAFPGLFYGASDSTGVTVSWQYDRYCTMEEGLQKMLRSVGYKLQITYDNADRRVIVQAVQIEDYSERIELSSDMRLNYVLDTQTDGVNHLILLGKGELRDRTVRHLYINRAGNIVTAQYYTGIDEIAAVFDYAGAELNDLVRQGKKKLRELANHDAFTMGIETDLDLGVGDIVGGRDYLTGVLMKAPIKSKVVKWESGQRVIEYTLENDADE